MNITEFYLEDLKSKFLKIDPKEYYLSYSGGRDSHFILWFLKVWLKENDYKMYKNYSIIPIVAVNTRMEYPEILRRMIDNSDIILSPELKPFQIKDKYGSPCFTKQQDQLIRQYNYGKRSESLMRRIKGLEGKYSLSKKARDLLMSGLLHNISGKCCNELKKKPFKLYEKKLSKKAILGVRASEGVLRNTQYQSCFHKNGKFTPIHDLTDIILKTIEYEFKIEIPNIYNYVDRTGCVGCPYGGKKNIENGLKYVSKQRLKFLEEYFGESWKIKKVNKEEL